MKIQYQKLHPDALPPQRMSEGAAGYDLFARLEEKILLKPGQRIAVSTGIALCIPAGYEAQIRPRSGLALKLGLGILNAPGTIDSDYRGEIKVILINLGREQLTLSPQMRIAQIIFSKVETVDFVLSESLDSTERADGGFGHSGH
jgi:dUTP pyrophosphatase